MAKKSMKLGKGKKGAKKAKIKSLIGKGKTPMGKGAKDRTPAGKGGRNEGLMTKVT